MSDYLQKRFGLEGRLAVVTGASSGIGAHAALTFARAGADVILCARRKDKIETIAAQIERSTAQKAQARMLDVTDGQAVADFWQELEKQKLCPDILFNNAGIARPAFAIAASEEAWDDTMDTNLKAVWRMAQASAKAMQLAGKKGAIINTASILGLGVAPMHSIYATSKAGVVQLTKALAIEFWRYGIRVNALCPGYFKTEINDDFLESAAGQKMLAQIPPKRIGALEELEGPLLLLASEAGSYLNGLALAVDGGHSIALAG